MQIEYDGSHSITFFTYRDMKDGQTLANVRYNTWTDWHLIPTSAPYVKPYEAKISIATIPGSTKIVDMSEALTGNVLKGRRTGEWEFIMDIERAVKDQTINVSNPWDLYYKIRNEIQGKWVLCILDDAKKRYYTGRIVISDFSIDSGYGKIKFTYNLGSYKSARIATGRVRVNAN